MKTHYSFATAFVQSSQYAQPLVIVLSLFVFMIVIPARKTVGAEINYAKALQMGIYFFEAQESGALSPGNRVVWRGPAHLTDGADAGTDLSGGWYDAGDHWKANSKMAYSAMMLAWSACEWPEAYTAVNQMDELLNGLVYVNRFFLKCIIDAKPAHPSDFSDYQVFVDVGGNPGPEPGVHSVWASPEVIDGYTVREALKGDTTVPACDVAGYFAASMCATAMVIARNGTPDQQEFARQLLQTGTKAARYAAGYVERHLAVHADSTVAITPNGSVRRIDYREAVAYPHAILGLTWAHRARTALYPDGADEQMLNDALALESWAHDWEMQKNGYLKEYAWWSAETMNLAALLLLTTAPALEPEVYQRLYKSAEAPVRLWRDMNPDDPNGWVSSPGGLRYRRNSATAFVIGTCVNAGSLAALFTLVDTTRNEQTKACIAEQADYILGKNPHSKSYMVGFDNNGSGRWWPAVHHRGAYGSTHDHWKYFDPDSPLYRPDSCRHVLYGGVLAGPRGTDDSFPNLVMNHVTSEVTTYWNARVMMMLAALTAWNRGTGAPYPDERFPPPHTPNTSCDLLVTDREFFTTGLLHTNTESFTDVSIRIHNWSQWPPRRRGGHAFRYYVTVDGGAKVSDLYAQVQSSDVPVVVGPFAQTSDVDGYFEVAFPGDSIGPFDRDHKYSSKRRVRVRFGTLQGEWDVRNDFSADTLIEGEERMTLSIPLYQDGELVGGREPGQTTAARHEKSLQTARHGAHRPLGIVIAGSSAPAIRNQSPHAVEWTLHLINGTRLDGGKLDAGEQTMVEVPATRVMLLQYRSAAVYRVELLTFARN